MLTQDDQQEIKKIIKEEIKHLPSLDHFDKRMDELLGEVQTMRDEETLHQGQHDEINERFDRVDKHLRISTTA